MGARAIFAWPAAALGYPARHIRWKIIAPYAALTVLLALAGTFLVTRLVGGSLDERFNNQLAEAGRVASDALVRSERRHLEVVRGIAFTGGVAEAAEARNGFALAPLVQPLVANYGAERVEVLAADGTRAYGVRLSDAGTRTYEAIVEDGDRSSWPLVRSALSGRADAQGDKYTQIVETPDGWVLYTAGPIRSGDRVTGAVLVGTLLPSFLAEAKTQALADITIYGAGGAPIASTYARDGGRDADLAPDARVLDAAASAAVREHRTLYGRDYDLLYAPLLIRGEPAGYYSVGLPSSFIFSAQSATREQMTLLFTVAMIAALFAGWLIARGMTRPLFRLVAAADAVSAGDLSARSGVAGRDEIGVLGRAFDAMTERLQRQHLATVRALTSAIDARDPYTMGHSLRVGQLAVELGRALGLDATTLQHLEIGGYLHDIGKIGVRDHVLLKPGALTAEERRAIERHPRIGLEILEHVELAPAVRDFVGGHHEKLNGSGYPQGRAGGELGIVPRIATVADIYDALTTDRPYRSAMSVEQALLILRAEARENLLDARVVDALEGVVDGWEERRRTEEGLRGYSLAGAMKEAA